jgi:hypothetical protein
MQGLHNIRQSILMYSGLVKLNKKKLLSPVNNSYLNIFQQ